MMDRPRFIRWFHEIGIEDVSLVGGKNASLGEMYRELSPRGIKVPNGFAITAEGYQQVLQVGGLAQTIRAILADLDTRDLSNLAERGRRVREAILTTGLAADLKAEILAAYAVLCDEYGPDNDVAVRSSATAEDLPDASFAGQQESFLNVQGERALLDTCHACFASLFTDRAISYRSCLSSHNNNRDVFLASSEPSPADREKRGRKDWCRAGQSDQGGRCVAGVSAW